MKIAVPNRAVLTALVLIALHVLAFAYVQWRDVLYDQNDLEGLLWWLVAFWVFPILALIVLVTSLIRHLRNRGN